MTNGTTEVERHTETQRWTVTDETTEARRHRGDGRRTQPQRHGDTDEGTGDETTGAQRRRRDWWARSVPLSARVSNHNVRPTGTRRLCRYSPIGWAQRLFASAADGLGLTPSILHGLVDYEVTNVSVHLTAHYLSESIRILHLSDLHADGIPDDGRQLVAVLRRQHADICVITGDFVDPSRADLAAVRRLLTDITSAIHARRGTYAVLGNHDPQAIRGLLNQLGVRVLDAGVVCPVRHGRTQFYVAGISLDEGAPVDGPRRFRIPDAGPLVFLVHSPDSADEAVRVAADYCLCGHTHGGQVCLPFGIPILTRTAAPRRMARGPWTWQGLRGYTSRGVGVCGRSPRIHCRPEIALHTLTGIATIDVVGGTQQ